MGLGLYNKAFIMHSKIVQIKIPVVIRHIPVEMSLSYGPMKHNDHVHKETFVLEVNYFENQIKHDAQLTLDGFGQCLFDDYSEQATKIAKDFCGQNNLIINDELNHWPQLQFIVSTK